MTAFDTVRVPCPACGGKSQMRDEGRFYVCARCYGHGAVDEKVPRDTCQKCKGSGRVADPTGKQEYGCTCREGHGNDPGGFGAAYCTERYQVTAKITCDLCKGDGSFSKGKHPTPITGVVGWKT